MNLASLKSVSRQAKNISTLQQARGKAKVFFSSKTIKTPSYRHGDVIYVNTKNSHGTSGYSNHLITSSGIEHIERSHHITPGNPGTMKYLTHGAGSVGDRTGLLVFRSDDGRIVVEALSPKDAEQKRNNFQTSFTVPGPIGSSSLNRVQKAFIQSYLFPTIFCAEKRVGTTFPTLQGITLEKATQITRDSSYLKPKSPADGLLHAEAVFSGINSYFAGSQIGQSYGGLTQEQFANKLQSFNNGFALKTEAVLRNLGLPLFGELNKHPSMKIPLGEAVGKLFGKNPELSFLKEFLEKSPIRKGVPQISSVQFHDHNQNIGSDYQLALEWQQWAERIALAKILCSDNFSLTPNNRLIAAVLLRDPGVIRPPDQKLNLYSGLESLKPEYLFLTYLGKSQLRPGN